jgi:hypothetical protein
LQGPGAQSVMHDSPMLGDPVRPRSNGKFRQCTLRDLASIWAT